MITVFDIGKTNTKMVVLDAEGSVVFEQRSTQTWIADNDYQRLDEAEFWEWVNGSLSKAVAKTGSQAAIFTTHSLTVGYVGDQTSPFPVLDYESQIPDDYVKAFEPRIPPFSETYSPVLPVSFNFGAQIDYLSRLNPQKFSKIKYILGYPQYLAWKLTGEVVSERTLIGSSSHCWSPPKNDYSSLVENSGWRELFPPLLEAGEFVGLASRATDPACRNVRIFNGIHDSNASLHFYRTLGHGDFTLVSTGTWVIIFNPSCPLDRLDQHRDMLANVTTDGEPVATLRFMGGREFDLISSRARIKVNAKDIARQIQQKSFALPSFAPGGQFANAKGKIVGPEPQTEVERAALASLYLACMTANGLDLIGSTNKIIIDGGLCRNEAYLWLVASLRPAQQVCYNGDAEGTSLGAACTIRDEALRISPTDPCAIVSPTDMPGLAQYFGEWKSLADRANGE